MDNLTRQQRSLTMSKIKSKNTRIELLVFKELRKRKIYFRKHYNKVPGKPDIALPKRKIAIFINGDFWHGYRFHSWKNKLPKKYWLAKITRNIERDRKNFKELRNMNWKVYTIWEHQLKKDFLNNLLKIIRFLEEK